MRPPSSPVRMTPEALNQRSCSRRGAKSRRQLHKTIDQANETLKHADGMIGENREEVRASVAKLHESLNNVSGLAQHLDQMLDVNSENIDEILENLPHITENMREFTDIIKTQPSSLIHSGSPRQHVPGGRP